MLRDWGDADAGTESVSSCTVTMLQSSMLRVALARMRTEGLPA